MAVQGNPLIDAPKRDTTAVDELERSLRADGATPRSPAPADDELPAKFRGKSSKEIADAYTNLESAYGRQANDFGSLRKMADELLELKRGADLGIPKEPERKKVTVTSSELLEKPTETLDRVIADREQDLLARVESRIANLEASTRATQFKDRHPDAEVVAQSEGFQTWIGESKIRQAAARLAASTNDLSLGDDLLTEYKEVHKDKPKATPKDDGLERARKLSLESSSGKPAANASGTRYKRLDLIAMKINNPKKYASLGDEITQAYVDGRVD